MTLPSFGEISLSMLHVLLRHGMTQTVFQFAVSGLKASWLSIVRGLGFVMTYQQTTVV
jgi:hypothetical protein